MKYTMSFEESDWEAVIGMDLLYLKQYLFVEGVAHHVEAWRVDDRDPATPPAAIQDQVQLLRRATDPAVIDEPWADGDYPGPPLRARHHSGNRSWRCS